MNSFSKRKNTNSLDLKVDEYLEVKSSKNKKNMTRGSSENDFSKKKNEKEDRKNGLEQITIDKYLKDIALIKLG